MKNSNFKKINGKIIFKIERSMEKCLKTHLNKNKIRKNWILNYIFFLILKNSVI